MPDARRPHPKARPEESPTAWFAVLERAWRTGDLDLRARAEQELARMGIRVLLVPHAEEKDAGGQP